ncbi:ankyrin repeat protein, putative [Trichomonas vaginalis G3]|uniref:Ankyrin repeat protein, putative n=1 Tax=Trichomonas vaginalis (strain ATCC PRA-98 / G3) TaxID=412133 RepID=A2EDW4_TRIV3|nr:spectrin binding [Trichomonas vaginalis G3]EAY09180.1 ankyrin repeat protein, putative [Trichomonas vaginalis G3]KAI5487033.1 spectrin binding [Trichomonas vaginalis G3]|eukprot:XP_001321403.1 ankyrin repeat protein [Trichomonas vaginalis G3]
MSGLDFDLIKEVMSAYDDIFKLSSNDPAEVTKLFNQIKTVLINKLKIPISDLLQTINKACYFHDRYAEGYFLLVKQIIEDSPEPKQNPFRFCPTMHEYIVYIKDETIKNYFQNIWHQNAPYEWCSPHAEGDILNSVLNCVMNDDDTKFPIAIFNVADLDKYSFKHPVFDSLTLLEWCLYYGAEKCFNTLVKNFNTKITKKCLEMVFISGNISILKKCLKKKSPTQKCMSNAICAHNNQFVKIFSDDFSVNIHDCIFSRNFTLVITNKGELLDFARILCEFNLPELVIKIANDADHLIEETISDLPLICVAAQLNNVEFVKFLLEKGVSVNTKGEMGMTPLHYAAIYHCTEVARVLIENGAEIDAKDDKDWTPLHLASEKNNFETMKILIEKGADVNAKHDKDATTLHCAADHNCLEASKILVEHGADVNAVNSAGKTPLMYACNRNCTETALYLIEKGADIEKRSNDGTTAFLCACSSGDIVLVKKLIELGTDVNQRDDSGSTGLLRDIVCNNYEITKLLIENHADVNAKNDIKFTPLHYAATKNNKDLINLLLENGAKINEKEGIKNNTPLHMAVLSSAYDVIETLLEHGADCTIKNDYELTPLELTEYAKMGTRKMELLLHEKTEASRRNNNE